MRLSGQFRQYNIAAFGDHNITYGSLFRFSVIGFRQLLLCRSCIIRAVRIARLRCLRCDRYFKFRQNGILTNCGRRVFCRAGILCDLCRRRVRCLNCGRGRRTLHGCRGCFFNCRRGRRTLYGIVPFVFTQRTGRQTERQYENAQNRDDFFFSSHLLFSLLPEARTGRICRFPAPFQLINSNSGPTILLSVITSLVSNTMTSASGFS